MTNLTRLYKVVLRLSFQSYPLEMLLHSILLTGQDNKFLLQFIFFQDTTYYFLLISHLNGLQDSFTELKGTTTIHNLNDH